MSRALILGVCGQDGSYLAEHLVGAGHEVFGLTRRARPDPAGVKLLLGDLLDQASLEQALKESRPDQVYNLAAVTAPGSGWGALQPPLLADATGLGVVRLLDAVAKVAPDARVVHASSSAIYDPHRYGLYGAAKQFAHAVVVGYRQQVHCSNAILFSHTSPRQDHRFLARRITATVARIAAGSSEHLILGALDAHRDWGYAPDYVRALPLIAAQDHPDDHVIATGLQHTVREMVCHALAAAELEWDAVVRVDPDATHVANETYLDVQPLRLATQRRLGWKPLVGFEEMVHLMVEAQIAVR